MTQDDLTRGLDAYIQEALRLRMACELPVVNSTPAQMLAFLGEIRSRLDRTEELLSNVMRARARAHRAHHAATAAADDAFDRAISANRSAPVAPGNEYTSARERTAEANLATIDLRHAARKAAANVSLCDEAADVIRLAHRGLDGIRQDTHILLRTVAFESVLER